MIFLEQIKRKVHNEAPFLGAVRSRVSNYYEDVSKGVNQFKDTITSKPRALYKTGAEFADGWVQFPKTCISNLSKGVDQFKDTIMSKPRALYKTGTEFAGGWVRFPKTCISSLFGHVRRFFGSLNEFISGVFFSKETRDLHEAKKLSMATKLEREKKDKEWKKRYEEFNGPSSSSNYKDE